MEQDKHTISHRKVGLQVLQPFVKTRMPIYSDRIVIVANLVYVMVRFILYFNPERSPKGTLFILCNVELHHHVTVHSFGIRPCTRCALNLITITRRLHLGRIVDVAALMGMQKLCAV
jgi:hypothetical protein